MQKTKPKVIVILGPTASGKSDLAVTLAKKFNGEVVSADSRQIYKGLNIGSGKITKKEMRGVKHYLLDVANPKKRFTANDFQKLAYKAIDDILKRKKVPIICGGTGFYIQSIVDGVIFPDVDPQIKLREKLVKLMTPKLFLMLKKLDPKKAAATDKNNRPRLIRAIEIAKTIGKNKKLISKPKYEALQIGINFPLHQLSKRISNRLEKRLKAGMIKEVENLHKNGLPWKRLEELGLEYRYVAEYLQAKITKQQMIDTLNIKILQYAKKQMRWFKRDSRIIWLDIK